MNLVKTDFMETLAAVVLVTGPPQVGTTGSRSRMKVAQNVNVRKSSTTTQTWPTMITTILTTHVCRTLKLAEVIRAATMAINIEVSGPIPTTRNNVKDSRGDDNNALLVAVAAVRNEDDDLLTGWMQERTQSSPRTQLRTPRSLNPTTNYVQLTNESTTYGEKWSS